MSTGVYWDDPVTGLRYSLEAFDHFETCFWIKRDKASEPQPVDVFVRVSNHCYTRKRKDEPSEAIMDTQRHRSGTVEERVFCPDRWQFGQGLPTIINSLADKRCWEGDALEVFYRHEGAPAPQSPEGWYLCFRLDYRRNKSIPVQLTIRSIHWRPNQPQGVRRHPPIPFKKLLARFLNRKEGKQ
ncbi:hypothetical protein [Halospina sp. K52047b]|uniref:hypothetical protein n=1 Tax=Halospina sp. K52047b TaxID=2614160 RepID=UPI00124AA4A0|nr:hypothetical protein [Halospina sp. K52047b]KAA8976137.1 hypothetical protein F3089_15790 [Halospina sp. K52047b]